MTGAYGSVPSIRFSSMSYSQTNGDCVHMRLKEGTSSVAATDTLVLGLIAWRTETHFLTQTKQIRHNE